MTSPIFNPSERVACTNTSYIGRQFIAVTPQNGTQQLTRSSDFATSILGITRLQFDGSCTDVQPQPKKLKLAIAPPESASSDFFSLIAAKNLDGLVTALESGNIDLKARNEQGDTPLLLAVGLDWSEGCKVLLNHCVDINQTNQFGDNVLHIAVYNNNHNLCKDLLSFTGRGGEKLDVNHSNTFGQTPLHYAAFRGFIDIYQTIVMHNGDQQKPDPHGFFPSTITKSSRTWAGKTPNPLVSINELLMLDPFTKEHQKEFLARKSLGNVFGLPGSTVLSPARQSNKEQKINLSGMFSEYFFYKIAKSFRSLASQDCEYRGLIRSQDANAVSTACQYAADHRHTSAADKLKYLKDGNILILNTGFEKADNRSHHVSVLFFKDRFILCDRRINEELDPDKLQYQIYHAFKFNPDKLTPEIIQDIEDQKYRSVCEFTEYFLRSQPANPSLLSKLEFRKTDFEKTIEKIIICFQETGNCSWSNSEGIILAILIMSQCAKMQEDLSKIDIKDLHRVILESNLSFQNWRVYHMLTLVRKYLQRCLQPSPVFTPDLDLLGRSIQHGLSQLEEQDDAGLLAGWKKVVDDFNALVPAASRATFPIKGY